MPGAPRSIFISYSRTDSAFVDRLEADLKKRGFDTGWTEVNWWVVTSGSKKFSNKLIAARYVWW